MPEQDQTPQHSQGFGPAESADETRQAQHTVSNDSPTDVNYNAVLCRAQGETMALMGKNFEANADRRNKIFDAMAPKLLKE
ncbi:hypothetical protein LCGC14_1488660 [marine sediment metagenome]|uniref:Uncharacterized protein n=1 Tax=marine sediment metagenome TaxID=412755 RepID=A0A0F9JT92_9ZZZZ